MIHYRMADTINHRRISGRRFFGWIFCAWLSAIVIFAVLLFGTSDTIKCSDRFQASSRNVLLIMTSKKRVRKSFSVDDLRQEVVNESSLQGILGNFMASQFFWFLVIYFQTTGTVAFHNRSELLPGRIFSQSRKLHKVAISFMTQATLCLKVICI